MHHDQLRNEDIESDDWESAAEAILADVEYDTKLGTEMGRDAIRLARGEISEAQFHEMYHERMVAEFGSDDRPTSSEDPDE